MNESPIEYEAPPIDRRKAEKVQLDALEKRVNSLEELVISCHKDHKDMREALDAYSETIKVIAANTSQLVTYAEELSFAGRSVRSINDFKKLLDWLKPVLLVLAASGGTYVAVSQPEQPPAIRKEVPNVPAAHSPTSP